MKITILGRGNAGCISAMHLAYYRKFIDSKVEIDLIYDSKIPPVPTGQGTALDFPFKLFENFGSDILNIFPHTIKSGIMYENWNKKNKKFFHPFPVGSYGLHIEPKAFQDYVCSNLKVNFKEKDENIENYDEIDSDYIIDCRGKPKSLDKYNKLVNPLNCALLSELPAKENDVKWTKATAHPNGWCFYIPLPTKTSLGYLFNSNITSIEEAEKNFKEIFGVKKINKVFPFNQYIAKEPIIDRRILLNGNKLFFLEPLEATAMASYNFTIKCYFEYIFYGANTMTTKLKIIDYVNKVQNFILWQYKNNTSYDSEFWKYASKLYKKHDKDDIEKMLAIIKDMSEEDNRKSIKDNDYYAQWQKWNFKVFYDNKI
mgnify:CR=1 FL=1|tara:strand:+ start:141 stop:1253 length:1113 start_codon:yes stop_codon:yes gene_type:complete